jgi:hypothetical protein
MSLTIQEAVGRLVCVWETIPSTVERAGKMLMQWSNLITWTGLDTMVVGGSFNNPKIEYLYTLVISC